MKMEPPPIDFAAEDVALRTNRRDSLFMKATVRCDRINHSFDVVVRNVSAGGMLVDSKLDLTNGDRVVTLFDGVGEVPGRVVWVQQGRFGVAFDVTINPQLVRKPVKTRAKAADVAAPRKFVSRLHGKLISRP